MRQRDCFICWAKLNEVESSRFLKEIHWCRVQPQHNSGELLWRRRPVQPKPDSTVWYSRSHRRVRRSVQGHQLGRLPPHRLRSQRHRPGMAARALCWFADSTAPRRSQVLAFIIHKWDFHSWPVNVKQSICVVLNTNYLNKWDFKGDERCFPKHQMLTSPSPTI